MLGINYGLGIDSENGFGRKAGPCFGTDREYLLTMGAEDRWCKWTT